MLYIMLDFPSCYRDISKVWLYWYWISEFCQARKYRTKSMDTSERSFDMKLWFISWLLETVYAPVCYFDHSVCDSLVTFCSTASLQKAKIAGHALDATWVHESNFSSDKPGPRQLRVSSNLLLRLSVPGCRAVPQGLLLDLSQSHYPLPIRPSRIGDC